MDLVETWKDTSSEVNMCKRFVRIKYFSFQITDNNRFTLIKYLFLKFEQFEFKSIWLMGTSIESWKHILSQINNRFVLIWYFKLHKIMHLSNLNKIYARTSRKDLSSVARQIITKNEFISNWKRNKLFNIFELSITYLTL